MGANVLVIEDNQTNLQLLIFLLKASGHRATGVANGRAALDIIESPERELPDLILCDMQLPVMDGYAVARRIKADPRLRAIPLVAVTAFAMPGDRERALTAGCDGYIPKPIVPEKFIDQLDPFLPAAKRGNRPQPRRHGEAAAAAHDPRNGQSPPPIADGQPRREEPPRPISQKGETFSHADHPDR